MGIAYPHIVIFMTPQEFKNLLNKYSRGECTPQEESFIMKWYEEIGRHNQHEIPEEFRIILEAKMWSRVQERMGEHRKSYVPYWRKIAAAVTIFFLAGAGAFVVYKNLQLQKDLVSTNQGTDKLPGQLVVIANNEQTIRKVTLRDGSEVTLQPNSEIQFPAAFGENREVILKGEAFFHVVRDTKRPFLVYSNEVVTRVLGTSFTVKAYENSKQITVAVRSGRVSVYKNISDAGVDNDEVILAPNQQAVYDRSKQEVSKELVGKPEIVQQPAAHLEMKYDGAQVVRVFGALEEIYGVDIQFDDEILSNCIITTSLKEEGLFERIKVICEAIGAQYEVQGTSIHIKSDGCN